jgi:hypothetical protein
MKAVLKILLAGSCGVALWGPGALAATHVIDLTLDKASGFHGHGGFFYEGPITPTPVAEGDAFDVTIRFLGHQTEAIPGPGLMLMNFRYSGDPGVSSGIGTATDYTFQVNATPSGVTTDLLNSGTGGASAGDVAFGGFEWITAVSPPGRINGADGHFTVDQIINVPLGKAYQPPDIDQFFFFYVRLGVTVPEPSTWAMMLLGVGGLGAVARRRRIAAT